MLAAGTDGLITIELDTFTPIYPLKRVPTAVQHGFNALVVRDDSAYVGCEDGSVLHVTLSPKSHDDGGSGGAPFYSGAGGAVLDLECSSSTLFVATAKGTVTGVDRNSGFALWRIDLSKGSISRNISSGLLR